MKNTDSMLYASLLPDLLHREHPVEKQWCIILSIYRDKLLFPRLPYSFIQQTYRQEKKALSISASVRSPNRLTWYIGLTISESAGSLSVKLPSDIYENGLQLDFSFATSNLKLSELSDLKLQFRFLMKLMV